ncbi:Acyl-CoA reductase (LuxC) [Rivularia sp. PCC 7116]|uniref:acyl-CoA reductase n=1 Tax=Rivularia sp. PCC 7116 TaxID=373994 RepID=UPI00029EF217|nr:acyl-CoA reductase [Rivularia sp. PCC 7116]AFY54206.1 Acyl-CoA reductase (LuxC) [Rivularia sp. PCC 7116]
MHNEISYLPSWLKSVQIENLQLYSNDKDGEAWICTRPKAGCWADVGVGLQAARERLQSLSIKQIIESIGQVAQQWLDPDFQPRIDTIERVAQSSLFSPESVAESFDVELRNYLPGYLWKVLYRELVDPQVLDCFRQDIHLKGYARALGPKTTLSIFTGNVPGLPALSMVRSLLVKSPIIAKVASGEPCFAAAFAKTLAEVEPIFGESIVCTYWRRDEESYFSEVLTQADAVIAYGSDAACAKIRKQIQLGQAYFEHGHKFSLGLVDESYIEHFGEQQLAKAIARDTCVFNQQACIAPQIYCVVGPESLAERLAEKTAKALADYEQKVPLGNLLPNDAAALQMKRATLQWQAALQDKLSLWQSTNSLAWTLTIQSQISSHQGGHRRYLSLISVPDLATVMAQLRPIAQQDYLQNVALGLVGANLISTAEQLAQLGATRICQPGRMVDPSMMWRHDGRVCVSELLHWCDVEMHEDWQISGEKNGTSIY